MRHLTLLVSVVVFTAISMAAAQWGGVALAASPASSGSGSGGASTSTTGVIPYDNGYDYYTYHSSTAAEGVRRGVAEVIRAEGQANLQNSMAMINVAEARRRELENQKLLVAAYFDLRRVNRDKRIAERGERGTTEDWARYAQMGKPRRLGPSELDPMTGRVNWPILLQSEQFAAERDNVEKMFVERAALGNIGAEDFLAIVRTNATLLDNLKNRVQELPNVQYLAARRFLESLTYEAGLPARYGSQPGAPALAKAP